MQIVYSILVIGGISSFLNYRLQNKWYKETTKKGTESS